MAPKKTKALTKKQAAVIERFLAELAPPGQFEAVAAGKRRRVADRPTTTAQSRWDRWMGVVDPPRARLPLFPVNSSTPPTHKRYPEAAAPGAGALRRGAPAAGAAALGHAWGVRAAGARGGPGWGGQGGQGTSVCMRDALG